MITFATLHGTGTYFVWGIKDHIQEEVIKFCHHFFIFLMNLYKAFEAKSSAMIYIRCGNGKKQVVYILPGRLHLLQD